MKNFDELKDVVEPIEFILEGKTYRIEKVTAAQLADITEVINTEENKFNSVVKQIAIYTGEDEEVFRKVDFRKLVVLAEYLTDEITKQKKNLNS